MYIFSTNGCQWVDVVQSVMISHLVGSGRVMMSSVATVVTDVFQIN